MNLTDTTLGLICEQGGGAISTGPFGSQLHASDYSLAGTPVVMPQDIGDNRISEDNIARVSEHHVERLRRHRLYAGDIVYSRRGDVERRALIREENHGWLCGTGCLRVSFGPNPVASAEFVSYQLGLQETRKWIVRHAVGATMLNLNTSILSNVPLRVPAIATQRAIAEVLGALDDKIAANAKLAALSDELVRAKFAHLTAASSDTALIGDVAEHPRDLVEPQEVESSATYVGLEHVPRRLMWLDDSGTADAVTSTKAGFQSGDVLFGKLRPYFHKVVAAPSAGICSTDILVLRSRVPDLAGYVLAAASSDATVERCTAASQGTRMPRTSWKDLTAVEVMWPGDRAARAFSAEVIAVRNHVNAVMEESCGLAQMRDALLPLLMSGKLRVNYAERILAGETEGVV